MYSLRLCNKELAARANIKDISPLSLICISWHDTILGLAIYHRFQIPIERQQPTRYCLLYSPHYVILRYTDLSFSNIYVAIYHVHSMS